MVRRRAARKKSRPDFSGWRPVFKRGGGIMPDGKKKRTIKRMTWFRIIENVILAAAFLGVAYLLYDYIFTTSIVISILKGVALLAVLAAAECMILACGGIDLSVANLSLLSSAITFYLVEKNAAGAPLGIIAGIAVAGLIGLVNGILIARVKVQPLVATLATGLFAYGISGAITNNIVLFDTCKGVDLIKSVTLSVIPVSFIFAVVIVILCYLTFKVTVIGRQVFAVGGSEKSAKLSGLNTDRIKLLAYTGAGFLAGVGGIMVLADSAQAARFFGAGAEIEVVFAAILGGVSLYSGPKIFVRAFVGAAIIAVINRILYGLFVFNYMRAIIIGILVVLALVLRKNIFKSQAEN
jgi:ribose transport system permease protein